MDTRVIHRTRFLQCSHIQHLLRQSECYKDIKKSDILLQDQAFRDTSAFHQRHGEEEENPTFIYIHRQIARKHHDQVTWPNQIRNLPRAAQTHRYSYSK
jgi:hypothetical protein